MASRTVHVYWMKKFALYYAASIFGGQASEQNLPGLLRGSDEHPFTSRCTFQWSTLLQYEDASTKILFLA